MNANFGLLEPLEHAPKDKFKKKAALAERALVHMEDFAGHARDHRVHCVS
jgi:folate-dependent tRNA-U54 methylase TrmFO/GidA